MKRLVIGTLEIITINESEVFIKSGGKIQPKRQPSGLIKLAKLSNNKLLTMQDLGSQIA